MTGRSKKGTFVPKTGTVVHDGFRGDGRQLSFAETIASALRAELGNTNGAIKIVMRWTNASERTVKYWFTGERGPSGEHLVRLAARSNAVFGVFLRMAGRNQASAGSGLRAAWASLASAMEMMREEIDFRS